MHPYKGVAARVLNYQDKGNVNQEKQGRRIKCVYFAHGVLVV